MENHEIKVNCFVYALADPAGIVRYIGATSKPKLRLRFHICDGIRVNDGRISSPTKKQLWIAELLKEGREPIMKILEECDCRIVGDREIFHYNQHAQEFDLLCANPKSAYKYNRSDSLIAIEKAKQDALKTPKISSKEIREAKKVEIARIVKENRRIKLEKKSQQKKYFDLTPPSQPFQPPTYQPFTLGYKLFCAYIRECKKH